MSRYERNYDDWSTLSPEEAIDRAYALGVAASFEEYHPGELAAIRAEMDSAYDKSVVDLAFDEGRTAALSADPDGPEAVWDDLVEGERVTLDRPDDPTGGRDGLPEALGTADALDRVDLDGRDATELPEFLEKD